MAGGLFAKVRHKVPMLSIRTETDIEASGAQNFDARVRRELGLPEARVRAADPKLWFAGRELTTEVRT